ncbi:sulfur carrier protein ThiS [Thermoflavimicrobium daqui]|jgi:sulfur carrier protein|uniref:Thiamine biosynthesis protein ThiS n=1 Tax=Thermoflavimicrobium daqui TaxID=2137476 RepID=A0A364K6H2_9BACL|nr:sulfur carrier protein ThiS [Thermoflavimicrobium daqui]RAL25894.1 thiamine biosynthesis protein ThiS [Thermoflavimicrobium daqui]
MKIQLNGKPYQVPSEVQTIEQLVIQLKIEERVFVIEHNRNILQREDYPQTLLSSGDIIEIVHFVGGG